MEQKYKPLFNNKARSLRLLRIKDKNGDFLSSTGIYTRTLEKNLFVPLTTDVNRITESILNIFGLNSYARFVKQYYFPKMLIFKPRLMPGPVKRIRTDVANKKALIKQNLPKMMQDPSMKLINRKNTIIDYSKVIDLLLFKDKKNLGRQNVRDHLLNIFPELITYFFTGDAGMDITKVKHANAVNVLSLGPTRDFLNVGFERICFTYKIGSMNPIAFSIPYLTGQTNLPRNLLLDLSTVYDFSVIRFILRALTVDRDDDIDSPYNEWIDYLSNNNVSFFFYNNNFAFVVDLKELKETLNWKDNKIIQTLRNCVIRLVKNNYGEITSDMLDDEIAATIEEEKEGEGIIDESEDPTDISTKQNIEVPKIPDYTKKQDDAFKKLVQNMLIVNKNKPKIISSVKESNIEIDETSDEYDEEFDSLKSNPEEDAKYKKYMEEQELKQQGRNISIDKDLNMVDDDSTAEVVEEYDEDVDIDEIVRDEEAALSDEDDMEIVDQSNQEDKTQVELEIENKTEEDAEDELAEEEKKAIIKSIERETKPKKSPKELARIRVVKEKYKSIKLDDNRTVAELLEDTKANVIDRQVKNIPHLKDESLKYMNVLDLEKSYVEKTMKKDTVSIIKSFSENKTINLHMLDVKVDDTSDAFNDRETYTIKFEDETQKRHTLKFDIPKVDENGRMRINGNLKILKKQLILKPIAKLGPDNVYITTQYNKVLLSRRGSTLNRSTQILKNILVDQLQNSRNVKIRYGNASIHNKDILTTVEYDDLGKKFMGFSIYPNSKEHRIEFLFSHENMKELIEKEKIPYTFTTDKLAFGYDFRNKEVIEINIKNKKSSVSGIILEKILSSGVIPDFDKEIAKIKVPRKRCYTEIELQSKASPLITLLGALFGLSTVINKYQSKVQLSEKLIVKDRRPFIKFKDLYLYYEDYPLENGLLLNGLCEMNTEDYNLEEYNTPAPYLAYLYKKHKTTNIFKGWTSFKELFIDPITKEILNDLSLPTDFVEVFLYANDLLGDNHFYHETDMRHYRVRGYEQINEYLYKALSDQYNTLKMMRNPAKLQFSVPNDVVIGKLLQSPLLAGCDITNPLNEMKEKSIVSYNGTSGVNLQQAFTMDKRSYAKNAMGVIGMASVDNGKVGITKELTLDCNIINTRGYIDPIEDGKDSRKLNYSKMVTIEESFFPYMMLNDDPNRIGFACNQTVHTEEVDGASVSLVGTGTDKMVAYRCPSTYAVKARGTGTIVDINEEQKKILVEYKDGKREVYEYGLKLIRNSNFYFENNLNLCCKKGQKVTENDILAYNPNFFEYEGNDVFLKMGVVANVAIFDGSYTDEDSTLITENISERMNTSVVQKKQISLSKNSNIIKYSKVGDEVLIGDALMLFEDTFEASSALLLDQLGSLSEDEKAELLYKSPKANASGQIIHMDVYWTVPLEEMRPSLRDFVMAYQRGINKEAKLEKEFTGKPSRVTYKTEIAVPKKDRIEGCIVPEDGGVIVSYYISHKKGVSVGDKISINSSLKSIVARVTPKHLSPYRENGPVDIITSYIGICKRQINSIYMAGAMGKILFDYGKRIAKEYLGKKD